VNIRRLLAQQKEQIHAMNQSIGTDYRDYLDYLEDNIGDDASWTMDQLQELLRPCFEVRLSKDEQDDYEYDSFLVNLDDLIKPVYIKDEGDFFSVWENQGRVDIPVRLLKSFLEWLKENGVGHKSEYDL
jgi:hypothetical protein